MKYAAQGDNVRLLRLHTKKWLEKVADQELVMRTTVEMVAEMVGGVDGAALGPRGMTAPETAMEERVKQTVIAELLAEEPIVAAYYRDYNGTSLGYLYGKVSRVVR